LPFVVTYGFTIYSGMTSVEHNLPFSRLYDDVLKLFAWSGTGYTPTHVVNYGGPPGEEYVWANHDVPNDPKCVCLSFFRLLALIPDLNQAQAFSFTRALVQTYRVCGQTRLLYVAVL